MSITKRERSVLLARGVAMVLMIGAKPLAKPAWAAVRRPHAELARERQMAEKELALIELHRSGALERAAERANRVVLKSAFIARDEALLYARASTYLTTVARQSGVRLSEVAVSQTRLLSDGLREIVLSVRGTGSTEAAFLFVYWLEHGFETASVDRLQLRRNEAVDATGGSLTFSMTLKLYGADAQ